MSTEPRILFVFGVPPQRFAEFKEQYFTKSGKVVTGHALMKFASVRQFVLEIPFGIDRLEVASDTVAVAERVGAMTLSESGAS